MMLSFQDFERFIELTSDQIRMAGPNVHASFIPIAMRAALQQIKLDAEARDRELEAELASIAGATDD